MKQTSHSRKSPFCTNSLFQENRPNCRPNKTLKISDSLKPPFKKSIKRTEKKFSLKHLKSDKNQSKKHERKKQGKIERFINPNITFFMILFFHKQLNYRDKIMSIKNL